MNVECARRQCSKTVLDSVEMKYTEHQILANLRNVIFVAACIYIASEHGEYSKEKTVGIMDGYENWTCYAATHRKGGNMESAKSDLHDRHKMEHIKDKILIYHMNKNSRQMKP